MQQDYESVDDAVRPHGPPATRLTTAGQQHQSPPAEGGAGDEHAT